ncbi:putative membrane protein [Escherichia coli DEC7E]|nr:putative membrane protein [Escherichia coli DEC7E]
MCDILLNVLNIVFIGIAIILVIILLNGFSLNEWVFKGQA